MDTTGNLKLSDVLHLYLGCECIWETTRKGNRLGKRGLLTIEALLNLKHGKITIQPILRPLSDMTEEEDKECSNIIFGEYAEKVNEKSIIHYEAKKITYLLSRHFDLFGLIESGQAINKTTINQ